MSYRAAIRLRRVTGDRAYEANTLNRVGDNHAAAGHPQRPPTCGGRRTTS